MAHRGKKGRLSSALSVCALSLILSLVFSFVGVWLYEKDKPQITQYDLEKAYSNGYYDGHSVGYNSGYDAYKRSVDSRATPTPAPTSSNSLQAWLSSRSSSSATKEPDYEYIGNKNSMIFHYPSCSSVGQMNNSNKVYLQSRAEAIERGYRACKRCYP